MIKKAVFLLLITASLSAQDFGFGFDNEESESGIGAGSGFGVSISGEVSASMVGYIDDFSKGASKVELGDIFSGKLNFSAGTDIAEGVININLKTEKIPVSIDEAYLRSFFGRLEITAGFRKLTWGKADSFGPLDVINPLDTSQIYTEMADNDSLMSVKIARPLIHVSFRFGQFSKIEAVFVPNFEPHRVAEEGRWVPAQMEMMSLVLPNSISSPDTDTLSYAQTGLRFTTTIGSADIGAQYYYGRLPQSAVKIALPQVYLLYNYYHQIGLDYAQVLLGFNIRTELAANITKDLKGSDRSVYNPSILWSFGFDRDLFLGVNLNLQVNESVRLLHDKLDSGDTTDIANIISGNFDIEGGSPLTSTRMTATVSRRFFRDQLEIRTAVVWGIEDNDCLVMPAIIWTRDELRIAFSGGFFVGDSQGQLGQYKDNNFIKVSMTFMF